MHISKIKWTTVLIHLIIWVIVLFLLNALLTTPRTVMEPDGNRLRTYLVDRPSHYALLAIMLLIKSGIFYFCSLWILPFFYEKNRAFIGVLLSLAVAVVAYFVEFLFSPYIYRLVNLSFYDYAKINGLDLYLVFFTLGLSLMFFFRKQWKEGKEKIILLEKHQQEAELQLLKSQLDPHFLFNVLNNLFSTAQKYNNTELADGIARLAELMRYALQNSPGEKVALKKEIEYAKNYIALVQTRYEQGEVIVKFDIQEGINELMVPFMVLMPFIENAFKHGVQTGIRNEISFSIKYTNGKLLFSGMNVDHSQETQKKLQSFGIGLSNIQKRLHIMYPGKNSISYGTKNGDFSFTLMIEP